MNTEPQMNVSDMVIGSVTDSVATVKRLFGLTENTETLPFMKIVLAARSLNGDAHEQVVEPIVNGLLKEFDLDPANNEEDRVAAADYAELIAMSISDATQLIYQEMQRQMHARAQAAGQAPLGG